VLPNRNGHPEFISGSLSLQADEILKQVQDDSVKELRLILFRKDYSKI
jgi:hypothetical protein